MPRPRVRSQAGIMRDALSRLETVEREGLWPVAWGLVEVAGRESDTASSASDQTVLSLTFTVVAGRWYRLRCVGHLDYGAGGCAGEFEVDGVVVGRWFRSDDNGSNSRHFDGSVLWPAPDDAEGEVTVDAVLIPYGSAAGLNASAARPAQLSVTDEGPVA